jgi:hypothetical protein
LNGGAHAFAGEGATIVNQTAAFDLSSAQQFFGGGKAGRSTAVAGADGLGLIVTFNFSLRKNGTVVDLNVESLIDEFDQNVRWEISGDFELIEFEMTGEGRDLIGGPGSFDPVGERCLVQVLEGDNLIERGFFEGAAELEGIEHSDFFLSDPGGDEGIVNLKAAEVAEIQTTVSVVEENESRFGHG